MLSFASVVISVPIWKAESSKIQQQEIHLTSPPFIKSDEGSPRQEAQRELDPPFLATRIRPEVPQLLATQKSDELIVLDLVQTLSSCTLDT